ncbi:MAG: 50S ribosomal protein L18 [Patescibacteria group bacterium]
MNKQAYKVQKRIRRHTRVRSTIEGSASRPRLAVFRSGKHIYAQVIDDRSGRTLASASDVVKQSKSGKSGETKVIRAKTVGETVAKLALAAKVKRVAFDRGGYVYAGRVKSLAEGARAGGLEF